MSKVVRERRAAQAALFDNKPATKPKKLPAFAIRELVDKWGIAEATARGFDWSTGWAILYRHREGRTITPEDRARLKTDIAARLREEAGKEDPDTRDLGNLVQEALFLTDCTILVRFAKGLAQVLDPKTAPAPAA